MPVSYRRPGRIAAGCALVAVATLLAGPAGAEPAPPYEALLKQRDAAPTVLEAGALSDAADARLRQARARPNPVLSMDLENAYGSGVNSGLDNAETTWTVSQDLELWGRRSSRISAARAEAGVAGLQRDFALIDGAGRLATTYAEAEAAQRRHALAQEALALTVADARAALKLVEEGREPLLRGIQGEAEAAAARATLDEALAERDAAFARLTATAMLAAPVTLIDNSLLDRAPATVEDAAAGVPEVRIAEAERLAAERRIAVQRSLGRPDLSASIGFRQYQADDSTALTFGLSVPLPLFDRNRGNVQAAQAELRAADARLTGARQTAAADRAAAEARLRASTSRVAAADGGVKAAEEAYRLSRLGFEAGRISQLELRASRAALINARNAAIDARLARVRAETELARLQGRAPFGGVQ
ncbi:MAG: TolC family protein [Caulobacter sp.]|nr:TolC family protein [Caulobacter sp.]